MPARGAASLPWSLGHASAQRAIGKGGAGYGALWIGSIQRTASGFSTGSISRFTTTAS